MVGKGNVTNAGSIPKLVAYWMPAMRTGGAKAPPVAMVSPSRNVVRVPSKSRAKLVSSLVTPGAPVRSSRRKPDNVVLPAWNPPISTKPPTPWSSPLPAW